MTTKEFTITLINTVDEINSEFMVESLVQESSDHVDAEDNTSQEATASSRAVRLKFDTKEEAEEYVNKFVAEMFDRNYKKETTN